MTGGKGRKTKLQTIERIKQPARSFRYYPRVSLQPRIPVKSAKGKATQVMQQYSFSLTVVLGSILYILSSFLVQSVSLVKQAVSRKDRLFVLRREGLRETC